MELIAKKIIAVWPYLSKTTKALIEKLAPGIGNAISKGAAALVKFLLKYSDYVIKQIAKLIGA